MQKLVLGLRHPSSGSLIPVDFLGSNFEWKCCNVNGFPVYPPMFTPYRILCYSWEINRNMRHDVLTLGCRLQIPYIEFFFFFFFIKVQTDAKWLLLGSYSSITKHRGLDPTFSLRRLITAKTSPPSLWSNPLHCTAIETHPLILIPYQIQVAKVFNQLSFVNSFYLP